MHSNTDYEDHVSLYPHQHEAEDDAGTPERLAAQGWIAELAAALTEGDQYRGAMLDRLTAPEQAQLDVALAARGLQLVEEAGYVYVEAKSS